VIGGWGGALVGISSLDDEDAAHNDTATAKKFITNQWYKIRMRVLGERLQTWIDDEKVVDIITKGMKVDVRADISDTKPLGLTSFQTTGAMRDIKIRQLSDAEVKAAESVPPESK
ncbi:MAG TPA: family 16 glycoside hydrolase, partial [Rhodopila sp.]